MSIFVHLKESRIGLFWLKNEKKIVLFIGIILIAAISFEAGYLQGQKNRNDSIVVNKISSVAQESKNQNADQVPTTKTASDTSAKLISSESSIIQTADPQTCPFVASKNSNKYHLATCAYAKKIKPENRVCFSSKDEAESRGYVGAKCCIK